MQPKKKKKKLSKVEVIGTDNISQGRQEKGKKRRSEWEKSVKTLAKNLSTISTMFVFSGEKKETREEGERRLINKKTPTQLTEKSIRGGVGNFGKLSEKRVRKQADKNREQDE